MAFRQRKTAAAALSAVCVITLAACGSEDGGGSVVGPSPTSSTTAISVIAPGAAIFIGSTSQFEARETLSDGTTRAAAGATWGSDRPAVAGVSATGAVTAVSAGTATISADANGARGTAAIRVFPSFAGTWTGTERLSNCRDSGDLSGLCAELGLIGQTGQHRSTLTQDAASVNAVVDGGDGTTATMTGTITVDGELQLNAAPVLPPDPELAAVVENWRSRADVPSRMTGAYDFVVTAAGLSGSVRFTVDLQNVTRTASSSAASAQRGAAWASKLRARMRSRHRSF